MTTAVSPGSLHPARKPDREDDENRYYDKVAFASDSYVPWIIGSLRLGSADLTRMRTSGCPVLRAHNGDNLVPFPFEYALYRISASPVVIPAQSGIQS